MGRIILGLVTALLLAFPQHARAEASTLRIAKQFGIGYMQYMVMQDQKLVEKHAKVSEDFTVERVASAAGPSGRCPKRPKGLLGLSRRVAQFEQ